MTAALGAGPTYSVGPISDLSGACSGQNAEVEQTVDPSHAGQGRAMVSSRGGASFDHGVTFPQVTSLVPPDAKNWGDRDFIAVGPDGVVYVTWDYGPNRTSITFICSSSGSCAFGTGDLNVVMQKSSDGGRTFGAM